MYNTELTILSQDHVGATILPSTMTKENFTLV